MARGYLVSYAGYPYTLSSLFPDNGLASLAAVLRAEGHECTVLDLNTASVIDEMVDAVSHQALCGIYPGLNGPLGDDTVARVVELAKKVELNGARFARDIGRRLVERCRKERPDFVGFKLWNGDGFEASLCMARQIREECPDIRLFAGGPSVHYCPDVVADEALVFDAVVDGDGEEAILELAKWTEGGRSFSGIPNVVNGEAGYTSVSDLSTLPLPAYDADVYPSVHDGSKIREFSLDESRGCPMRCAFCINWCIEGTRWRTRRAEQVIEEIVAARERYSSRAFRLAGNYTPPRLLREVCQRITREGIDVQFGLSLCAAGADPELLSDLRSAGCVGVFFGVESGSNAILEHALEKPARAERQRRVIEGALREGMFVVGSFIFPAPFETEDTEQETRSFIQQVFAGRENAAAMFTFPGLIPRTRWWTHQERYGFALDIDEDDYRRMILRYKIRHLLPPPLWDELPYRLNGVRQHALAARNNGLQTWARDLGITVNMADHDAQIGAALGFTPVVFQRRLRERLFTGDGAEIQSIVDRANAALAP